MNTTCVYKDHAIIAAGKRDERTRKYKPVVHIAWRELNGRRQCHSFSLPEACDTFDEASARARKAANAWVDRRLIHIGP